MTTTDQHRTGSTEASALASAGNARVLVDGPIGALLLIGPDRTRGAVSFVVHPLAPRTLGSPMHTHSREDEWSCVLEGEVGMQVGDEQVVARPGDAVIKPRGVAHAFWNATDEPAKVLEVITPSGFERYFEELGVVLAEPQPDLARVGEIAARYGLVMDPESVPRLAADHGLRLG
jgi:mannose-6-phosphate isomerase-like protein (cupin superfamily)